MHIVTRNMWELWRDTDMMWYFVRLSPNNEEPILEGPYLNKAVGARELEGYQQAYINFRGC